MNLFRQFFSGNNGNIFSCACREGTASRRIPNEGTDLRRRISDRGPAAFQSRSAGSGMRSAAGGILAAVLLCAAVCTAFCAAAQLGIGAAAPLTAYAASDDSLLDKALSILGLGGVNNKSDKTFTLMVYMIGSDLETLDGAASKDIEEMLNARYSDEVNVVIQTGGSNRWANPLIDASKNQRFVINSSSEGLKEIQQSGKSALNTASALRAFIRYSAEQYPADRYGLILWNHGGGTILGYGLDESNAGKMMLLSELGQALNGCGVHFDFIGFDACLMATLEVAFTLSPHADYLIASEETEPSSGWYYPNWLTSLSGDTGMDTASIGRMIIREFMGSPDYNKWDTYTLALIRLSKARSIYESLKEYFGFEAARLQSDYTGISKVRSSTKSFGDGRYEQVDLIDLLGRLQGANYAEVLEDARACVEYFDGNVSGSNGLAVYFPFAHADKYGTISGMLSSIGYEAEYFKFYSGFMSNLTAGQQKARTKYSDSMQDTPAGNSKGGLVDDKNSVSIPESQAQGSAQ